MPVLLAILCLAFLLNLTAFPLMNGLMPYVAKTVYGADQQTLGWLVASGACGALAGSIAVSRYGALFQPGRMMLYFSAGWYLMLMVFAQTLSPTAGIPVLLATGISFSLGQIPMAAILLRSCDERFRGRLMGVRMLAIYGNLPGLWIAGPLIAALGYSFTATLYCLFGLTFIVLVALRWRGELWRLDAPANAR